MKEVSYREVKHLVTAPTFFSHKYTRGVLGLLTGSETYPGAGIMSARAAVNTGAGLVRFAGSSSLNFQLQLTVPEAVCSLEAPENLRVDAWALGSGLAGETRETQVAQVIASGQPAIIDAGAVSLAARLLADGLKLKAHHILTPHAGEAAEALTWLFALAPALLQAQQTGISESPSRQAIESEPETYARLLARASGATVLLKGGASILANPSGQTYRVQGKVPWLATAGSGDTLTGILGALLARYQAEEAKPGEDSSAYAQLAAAGVLIHNLAAELVHGPGLSGPTPPSLVAQKIPEALAIFLQK